MNTIAFCLSILCCAVCGVLLAILCLWVLNNMPASWLCDYGEEPDEALLSKKRFSTIPYGIVLAALLIVSFVLCFLQYGTSPTFFCASAGAMLLILIALCDAKYTIIPDQFTLCLLVPALCSSLYDVFGGGKVFHTHILLPLMGAVCGGAVMLLLGLLGKIIYKKDATGFGDVKLFAVLGLFVGPVQIMLVFLMTILLAGVHFSYLMIRKKIEGNRYLPFGPYICTAFLLFLAFHSQINTGVSWYFSLFH